jgi:hypothetical protein
MGDGYLRRLLVVGAMAVCFAKCASGGGAWIMGLLERKKPSAAAVAVANKSDRLGAEVSQGELCADDHLDDRLRRSKPAEP